jgi:site-specific recombinase XerD
MNHETIEKALEAVASAHTRRMYERALKRLAGWLNGRELSYTTAREYKAEMVQSGFSPQNINIANIYDKGQYRKCWLRA